VKGVKGKNLIKIIWCQYVGQVSEEIFRMVSRSIPLTKHSDT
jgi:hypothetical protein